MTFSWLYNKKHNEDEFKYGGYDFLRNCFQFTYSNFCALLILGAFQLPHPLTHTREFQVFSLSFILWSLQVHVIIVFIFMHSMVNNVFSIPTSCFVTSDLFLMFLAVGYCLTSELCLVWFLTVWIQTLRGYMCSDNDCRLIIAPTLSTPLPFSQLTQGSECLAELPLE